MKIFFSLFSFFLFFKSYIYSQTIEDSFYTASISLKDNKRPKIGLALSGGGARGFAHVGVLQTLKNHSIPIDYISGTSMGAVIGGFYSINYDLNKIWYFGLNINKYKVSKDFSKIKILKLMLTEKLIDPFYIRSFIDNNFLNLNFNQLKIPFACVAMDLRTGEKVVFKEGPLDIAIKASINLPGFFKPLEYGKMDLVDGGVVDFLPVDVLKDMGADWIISSITEGKITKKPENVFMTLMQVIDIRGNLILKNSKEESNFIFLPNVSNIMINDFDKSYQIAREAVIYSSQKILDLKNNYIIDSLPYIIKKI